MLWLTSYPKKIAKKDLTLISVMNVGSDCGFCSNFCHKNAALHWKKASNPVLLGYIDTSTFTKFNNICVLSLLLSPENPFKASEKNVEQNDV